VRGVERSCFERGYSLVLCNTEGDEQRMNRNLETLMQKRVDGLLLLCTETHQPSKEIMQRYPSVPTVMMDWAPFDGTSDLIQDNSLLGGDMATQYLIDKGILALPVLPGRWIKPRRVCVWKGISGDGTRGLPFLMATGLPVILNLTAVSSDAETAGGSVRRRCLLVTMRWRLVPIRRCIRPGCVPQDMAVVGYDDIELAAI
jgi:LacI family transcriptional regulator